jgi:hypothetical protein
LHRALVIEKKTVTFRLNVDSPQFTICFAKQPLVFLIRNKITRLIRSLFFAKNYIMTTGFEEEFALPVHSRFF